MSLKIALLGEKVEKSLSPRMQNAAFQHLNLPYTYEAISVSPDQFENTFRRLQKEGFLGFNITIPYKEKAVRLLDESSDLVQKLESVNTILFSEKTRGENTDVYGCLESLERESLKFKPAKTVFLFGCGGAAKASVEALSQLGAGSFAAASRTQSRLEQFRSWFRRHYSFPLKTLLFQEFTESVWEQEIASCDVFVNAAPLEAVDELRSFSKLRFPPEIFLIEWIYLPRKTPWIEKAIAGKGSFVEGYKILLFQGAKSFTFWTGREAPVAVMENALLEGIL